ncbi:MULTISPECIES: hypothetical protein [unclassified Microbacterium]|uniref:hypothetical protein n=1 Tax=unclassified Microbacterium TaxID=2609290 RepID=UPI00109C4F2A|nr:MULTISPECIES: hypothetical protein [unclassified Microbacterium]
MEVIDATGVRSVPPFWSEVGWARPYHFLGAAGNSCPGEFVSHDYLADKIVSGFTYSKSIARKSLTRTKAGPISRAQFSAVLRCMYQALSDERDIVACVVTDNVEAWADAAWVVENEPRSLRQIMTKDNSHLMSRMLQGQEWAQGAGIYVLLCLDWRAVQSSGQDVNAAYANALVKVGRIGHALLLEGQHHNLVARMTPAIHESSASALFRLSEDISPIYAIRLSEPT